MLRIKDDVELKELAKFGFKILLEEDEFQKRIKYQHFNEVSMYQHSLENSYMDYLFAKKYGFSNSEIIEASIAGLLHNFYPIIVLHYSFVHI